MYSFAVAVALIFNQYVNPIALTKLKWKCEYLSHFDGSQNGFRKLTPEILYCIRRLASIRTHRHLFPVHRN